MKKLLVLLFVLVCALQLAAKVDLNTADLDELLLLPITQKQAQDILEYREHVAIFGSIYDLRKIPSIDQKTLLKIKDLAVVSLYIEEDDVAARRGGAGHARSSGLAQYDERAIRPTWQAADSSGDRRRR